MRAIRIPAAFIAGAWLYYATVVFTGGVLSAVAVPRSYFTFFGKGHTDIALALLSLVGWAIPIGVMVAGGMLALNRLLPGDWSSVWKSALAGMVMSFLYWALISAGFFAPHPESVISIPQAVFGIFYGPWWGAPSFLAPWVGFGLAVGLTGRLHNSRQNAEA